MKTAEEHKYPKWFTKDIPVKTRRRIELEDSTIYTGLAYYADSARNLRKEIKRFIRSEYKKYILLLLWRRISARWINQ